MNNQDQLKGLCDLLFMTRNESLTICSPLSVEDHNIQSMPDVSPPKWHLAHTTWFFETLLLKPFVEGYQVFHESFEYLFNSYYESVGTFHPRVERGNLSQPSLESIHQYRNHVDEWLKKSLQEEELITEEYVKILEIGIQHEKQHQELLLMDLKYNFWKNPLLPQYSKAPFPKSEESSPCRWLTIEEGIYEVGAQPGEFHYDNEGKQHRVFLEPVTIADRLITNGEYLGFIEAGGYVRAELWLSDGWHHINKEKWKHPLYWSHKDGEWCEFTLHGLVPLDMNAPASHLSYFEADAYARWCEARLPTEFEWEALSRKLGGEPSPLDLDTLHPNISTREKSFLGNLWQWTSSSYSPYPGFKPEHGALGEYNGKFMCNQYVLRGGSIATPSKHMRHSYRNFFPAHSRWMFSGLRLAKEV